MVISSRSVLKSIPGMVVPLSADGLMEAGPFRSLLYMGNGERSSLGSFDALPTGGVALDPTGLLERLKCVAQAFVFD